MYILIHIIQKLSGIFKFTSDAKFNVEHKLGACSIIEKRKKIIAIQNYNFIIH